MNRRGEDSSKKYKVDDETDNKKDEEEENPWTKVEKDEWGCPK